MREQLLDQYTMIRKTLVSNVETIRLLIEQAEALSTISEQLNGTSVADQETKDKLKQEVNKMRESISKLIEQTDELFDLYNKSADALFSSK